MTTSIDGVRVRLSLERWHHILTGHSELTGRMRDILATVSKPDEIRAGRGGARIAIRALDHTHWMAVVYREDPDDGFIVTAMITSRYAWIARREKLWPT